MGVFITYICQTNIKRQGGLELVPAWSNKPNDTGSIPVPGTHGRFI